MKQIELMFWASKLHGAVFGIVLQDDKKTQAKIMKIQDNIDAYGKALGICIDPKHRSTERFRILTYEGNQVKGFVEVVAGSGAAVNTFRSETMHYIHLSELAFWQHPEPIWEGIEPTLVQTEGIVQIESTPNGFNLFHELYTQNKGKKWNSQTDFVSLFYPWTLHKEYSESPPKDWFPCGDDIEYMSQYGISLSQAYWRRKVGFKGETNPTKRQLLAFAREYPASDETCWEETIEASPFRMDSLKKMLVSDKFETDEYGTRIYSQPDLMKSYIIGIDVAEGASKGGDDNAFVIIDEKGEIAALYASDSLSYLEYGALIYEMACKYRAEVVIEINKDYGSVIADYLEEKLFKYEITRFRTTGTAQGGGTRPEVIAAIDKWITTHIFIKDEQLRKQMIGFSKVKAEQRKKTDDLVMALGFAVHKLQSKLDQEYGFVTSRYKGES